MKRIPFIISLFLAVIIFEYCGTSAKVKMLKPAELDVGAVKTIAVLDFDFIGSWDYADAAKSPKTLKAISSSVKSPIRCRSSTNSVGVLA